MGIIFSYFNYFNYTPKPVLIRPKSRTMEERIEDHKKYVQTIIKKMEVHKDLILKKMDDFNEIYDKEVSHMRETHYNNLVKLYREKRELEEFINFFE